MSDQGWGSVDDVMDGKFQLIRDSVAKTAYPGWSDPWPWSCMGSGYGCYRTAVGRNGNTGFLAIVGASHGYGGLTTADFARVLRSLGATQAMGFDANSAAEFTRNGKSPMLTRTAGGSSPPPPCSATTERLHAMQQRGQTPLLRGLAQARPSWQTHVDGRRVAP